MSLDLLAIGSHPDDVELSSGGLIAKLSEREYRIGIIDLTRGERGTYGSGEVRVKEAKKAADILNVEIRENMDFGDCELSSDFDRAKKLADKIREYRPSILLIPYGDESHPDHGAGRKLSKRAAFLAKLSKIGLNHEAHTVKNVIYFMMHKEFEPTFIVDVTENYERKVEAIKAYSSQMKLMTEQGGLLKAARLRDRRYGFRIGSKYGEPFYSDSPLKIDDPVSFLT